MLDFIAIAGGLFLIGWVVFIASTLLARLVRFGWDWLRYALERRP